MSNGMISFTEMGLADQIERYVSFEYDTKTIGKKGAGEFGFPALTASHNFPNIEQRGDIFKADFTEFIGFDYVLAGFPCTKFSIAQKKDRETKPYSGIGWDMFEKAWEAVQIIKPRFFLFENNKSMAKEIQDEISRIIGFKPLEFNSALLSAQQRKRIYWLGKRNPDGTYSQVHVELPEDKGLILQDILEDGIADRDKAYCLKHQAGNARDYIKKHHTQVKFEPVRVGAMPRPNGELSTSQAFRIYSTEGKSVNINAGGGGCGGKTGLYAVPVKVGEVNGGGQGNRVYSVDGKSVSQTATSGGLGSNTGLYAIPVPTWATPIEWDENNKPTKATSGADGKEYQVYEVENGLITFKDKKYKIALQDGFYIIRKLSVLECMRLQTVPEWYDFSIVSDTHAYEMLGNGWTVAVIIYLLSHTLE